MSDTVNIERKLCACGCGQEIPERNTWVNVGHSRRGKSGTRYRWKSEQTRLGCVERGRRTWSGESNPMKRSEVVIKQSESHTLWWNDPVDGDNRKEEQAIRMAQMLSDGTIENRDTSLEKILQRLLDSLRVNYQPQHHIWKYCADFADLENKVIYEADGPHHDDPQQQAHDQKRDAYLRLQGWIIKRFAYWQLGRLERILNRADLLLKGGI
jgi:very-short-patch-repair endonuclease